MPKTISHDRVLLYEYARSARPNSFMISEASRQLGIREGSAARHALDFEELGIFESNKVGREQEFRIRPDEYLKHIDLVRRMDVALPIVRRQRAILLQRAADAERRLASWQRTGESDSCFQRPDGRRKGDAGPRQ